MFLKMKILAIVFVLFIYTNAQIPLIANTSNDTTSETNSIGPFTDIFPCSCDLYANICDTYCCCDPDCPSSIISTWTSQDLCTTVVDRGSLFQKCPDDSLLQILRNPKTQQNVENMQISTFFCVEYDMAPYAGYFYLEDRTTSAISTLEKNFNTRNDEIQAITTTTPGETYSSGQKVYYNSAGALQNYIIPKVNQFGLCNDNNAAIFLEDIPSSTCTRLVTLSNCLTEAQLSKNYFMTTLLPLIAPNISAAQITPTERKIVVRNGAANAVPSGGGTGTGSCSCNNVMVGADIYLEHDGEGLLTEAVIDFAFDAFTSTNCENEVVPIQQTFGLHYVMNVSGVPKSGSPGYLVGSPLLVGIVAASNGIDRPIGGFHIEGISTTGECLLSATTTPEIRPSFIPKFGQNSTFSCSVPTTNSDAFCTSLPNYALFTNFAVGTNEIRVGRFGSSNNLYLDDWIAIDRPDTVGIPSATYANNICTTRKDEEIYVFYSEFGLENDPLYYVIRAVRYFVESEVDLANTGQVSLSVSFKYIKVTN